MTQVFNTKELGNHIMYFSAANTDKAIEAGKDWCRRRNFVIRHYFVQVAFGGKSILIGYQTLI